MIFIIERFNLVWEAEEKSKIKYKIDYVDYNGNKRIYHSDFILNDKFLVEIKPKHLWNIDGVKRKKEAAEIWCKEHNFIYKLTECPKQISFEKIKQLIEKEKLIFTNRYQEKWKMWQEKES